MAKLTWLVAAAVGYKIDGKEPSMKDFLLMDRSEQETKHKPTPDQIRSVMQEAMAGVNQ